MASEFVFEADVMAACGQDGEGKECERVKKQYIMEECYGDQLKIFDCERQSRMPLCLDERNQHIACLLEKRKEIDAAIVKRFYK
jgi:hypothetical protein